jgi:cob(I)alamin adenosyltransferase
MTNLSESEKEKILEKIDKIQNDLWEAREYISSDYCKKCSEIYSKIFVLEQQLKNLQSKIDQNS